MTLFVAAVIAATTSPFAPQPLIIGPFKLGDLILSNSDSGWLAMEFKDGGLDVDEVKKQMNGWKGYIVERRVRQTDGTWTWTSGRWDAKLLVEGRMSIELKDSRGEKVEIALTEARILEDHRSMHWKPNGEAPFVQCLLAFNLRFNGLVVPVTEGLLKGAIARPKESSDSIRFRYDVTGRAAIEKPEPKK